MYKPRNKFVIDTSSDKCWHCRAKRGFGPMLRTKVWKTLAPQHALLCVDCQVKLLGRDLRRDDLRPCLFNISWYRVLGFESHTEREMLDMKDR